MHSWAAGGANGAALQAEKKAGGQTVGRLV